MHEMTGLPALPEGSRLLERRLQSGTRLLAVEMPSARQSRLVAAVGVGYLDEPAEWPGLAHLLEHALFLGSARHPEAGDFAAWVAEQGGRYNAHTDEYVTDVHVTLPPDSAETGVNRLVELMVHPRLAASSIESEIAVIDAEFQARLADPDLHRQAALGLLCHTDHPAHRLHHGHRGSLEGGLQQCADALTAFHRAHYRAERFSLVLLGPQPAERQLEWLAHAATTIQQGTAPHPERHWRWAPPARIQWGLPNTQASQPMLELIWPLSEPLSEEQYRKGARLAAALCDGTLAATLRQHGAILDMDAVLRIDGTAPVVALTLTLTVAGLRQIEPVLATCQARVAHLSSHLPAAMPRPDELDLDRWPRQAAVRLALADNQASANLAGIPTDNAFAAERCRVLEPMPATHASIDVNPETGTRLRRLSPDVDAAPWPVSLSPILDKRHPIAQGASDPAPWHETSERQRLWWGSEPVLDEAFLGIAWPTSAMDQPDRVARWLQRTLALRQAARHQGIQLTLGGDGHGDWLLAWGDAERLVSGLEQAVAAWPRQADEALRSTAHADIPSHGLLAQRLLAQLDSQPLPAYTLSGTALESALPQQLAWAGGNQNAETALDAARALLASLPDPVAFGDPRASRSASHPVSETAISEWPTQWLAAHDGDRALMLQVDAPDASAESRALFQLLAQCHDAAFCHEMRQQRQLGYACAVRYREAGGWPRIGYVVQSPGADIPELRRAIVDFVVQQGPALARLAPEAFIQRCRWLSVSWGAPETERETRLRLWHAVRQGSAPQTPWLAEQEALASLAPDALARLGEQLAEGTLTGQWWGHAPARRRWE
ncbi:insulinase family protein [Litchfieldella xinjiangensis]|uniref:insulinase family protein n=1 Tax=Litchfieldella xinjiangensis TaxID=1166948 RepID=UPI0005BCC07C|nr:insulinase family protein [Halomonas xinjiangensis]